MVHAGGARMDPAQARRRPPDGLEQTGVAGGDQQRVRLRRQRHGLLGGMGDQSACARGKPVEGGQPRISSAGQDEDGDLSHSSSSLPARS